MKESFYLVEPAQVFESLFDLEGASIVETGNPDKALIRYVYTEDLKRNDVYLKRGNGAFYNPWGTMNEPNELTRTNRVGESAYTWKKVSKKVEDLYIKFLQTKNPNYLREAERSL